MLTLSYPLSSSFYLSWVCCFPLRPVPSHLLSKPKFLLLGPLGLSVVAVLIVVVLFNCVLVDFPFLCLCLLFCFEIMTTNAVFPAILWFFKRVLLSMRQKKGFRQFERCFAPFFPFPFPPPPPKPFFFKNTLGFSFSLVFSFSAVIPFNIPCFFSSTPFQILFSLCLFAHKQTALKDPV